MLSHRSTWLFLAVLALTSSSCLHSRVHQRRALAVKAESEADLPRAQTETLRSAKDEPEYVEGQAAPEAPAALAEPLPSAPSPAHVWIAGQHTRRGGQWEWVPGRFALPPRADVVWVPGHWVPHLQGYVWIAGAWR